MTLPMPLVTSSTRATAAHRISASTPAAAIAISLRLASQSSQASRKRLMRGSVDGVGGGVADRDRPRRDVDVLVIDRGLVAAARLVGRGNVESPLLERVDPPADVARGVAVGRVGGDDQVGREPGVAERGLRVEPRLERRVVEARNPLDPRIAAGERAGAAPAAGEAVEDVRAD